MLETVPWYYGKRNTDEHSQTEELHHSQRHIQRVCRKRLEEQCLNHCTYGDELATDDGPIQFGRKLRLQVWKISAKMFFARLSPLMYSRR